MQYTAVSKNVHMSPRKVRLVVDEIKKLDIPKALSFLALLKKRASVPVKKTIESAMANAVNNFKVQKGDLMIKEIQVLNGISYKRYHFAARGRVRPYKRRTSNIKVILSTKFKNDNTKSETKTAKSRKEESG